MQMYSRDVMNMLKAAEKKKQSKEVNE